MLVVVTAMHRRHDHIHVERGAQPPHSESASAYPRMGRAADFKSARTCEYRRDGVNFNSAPTLERAFLGGSSCRQAEERRGGEPAGARLQSRKPPKTAAAAHLHGLMVPFTAVVATSVRNELRLARAAAPMKPVSQPLERASNAKSSKSGSLRIIRYAPLPGTLGGVAHRFSNRGLESYGWPAPLSSYLPVIGSGQSGV